MLRFSSPVALVVTLLIAPVVQVLAVDLIPIWARLGDDAPGTAIDLDNGSASVEAVEFSPDGRFILAGSSGVVQTGGERVGQRVTLWDRSGELLWELPRDEVVKSLSWMPDGTGFAIGGKNGAVSVFRVLSIAGGPALTDASGALAPESVTDWQLSWNCDAMRFNHDGSLLALGDKRLIRLYRCSDWQLVESVDNLAYGKSGAEVNSLDWTADDTVLIAAGGLAENLHWWQVTTSGSGDEFDATLTSLSEHRETTLISSKSVRFNDANELQVASAWGEGISVVVQCSAAGYDQPPDAVATLDDTDDTEGMEFVEFTPDGAWLLTGGMEGRLTTGFGAIRIYDVADGLSLAHTEPVFRQEYLHCWYEAATGITWVVSGHEDGSLRLWAVAEADTPLRQVTLTVVDGGHEWQRRLDESAGTPEVDSVVFPSLPTVIDQRFDLLPAAVTTVHPRR